MCSLILWCQNVLDIAHVNTLNHLGLEERTDYIYIAVFQSGSSLHSRSVKRWTFQWFRAGDGVFPCQTREVSRQHHQADYAALAACAAWTFERPVEGWDICCAEARLVGSKSASYGGRFLDGRMWNIHRKANMNIWAGALMQKKRHVLAKKERWSATKRTIYHAFCLTCFKACR